MNLKFIEGG
jgi:hypothetical protein